MTPEQEQKIAEAAEDATKRYVYPNFGSLDIVPYRQGYKAGAAFALQMGEAGETLVTCDMPSEFITASNGERYVREFTANALCEENARLKAENVELRQGTFGTMLKELAEERDTLKAQNEKLRAALGGLGLRCSNTGMYGPLKIRPGECTCANCIARQALEESK